MLFIPFGWSALWDDAETEFVKVMKSLADGLQQLHDQGEITLQFSETDCIGYVCTYALCVTIFAVVVAMMFSIVCAICCADCTRKRREDADVSVIRWQVRKQQPPALYGRPR